MKHIKLKEIIQSWKETGIEGKSVRVVWSGDLQFVSFLLVFGHGEASSTYPCVVLCKFTKYICLYFFNIVSVRISGISSIQGFKKTHFSI